MSAEVPAKKQGEQGAESNASWVWKERLMSIESTGKLLPTLPERMQHKCSRLDIISFHVLGFRSA